MRAPSGYDLQEMDAILSGANSAPDRIEEVDSYLYRMDLSGGTNPGLGRLLEMVGAALEDPSDDSISHISSQIGRMWDEEKP